MKIEFYIFRHGQTDWNKLRKVQGKMDIPLNDFGREEALKLKSFFKDIDIEKVYTSDLKRAFETAEITFSDKDLTLETSERLREANFGEVEGMNVEDLLNQYSTKFWDIHIGGEEADDFSYPGGETRREVRERVVSQILDIKREGKYSKVAISTHGGSLRSLIHHFLPPQNELIKIPNCVVYKLTFNGDEHFVEGPFNNEEDLCYR
ncbi:hypothetical protein BIY24_02195 [Halobacteriovorax marinus]|uniref:histidine phosphatase family protein n=1 Tax=Halobacteriovorax marinus TaxID=97084 RepID=UPI000BC3153F|nr:histidine phosphatase family protein [Halobacteriovorax marinus]ATH06791.1 hypothetical protein BIY24_02195 [Halobacteriovorax marinus]